jgi:predicted AAA+ superfamily ATPase
MIKRTGYVQQIQRKLKASLVVAILGPRQVGKTTLARAIAEGQPHHYFDLEDAVSAARLAHPQSALEPLRGLVVIDEIQRQPELFALLRVLADRRSRPATFLILGSASPQLVRGVSESLAGRVTFVDLAGFDLSEVRPGAFRKLWWRGGFPRSFLAASDPDSAEWRQDFIRTFLERDIPQLGITIPAATLRRFWSMIAHFHGQVWNAADFARSLGTSEPTARKYLDILASAFMVRQLPPWFENLGKRQVKAPKIYVRDTGLLHTLLALGDFAALEGHPRLGASWEGFALEQVLRHAGDREAYFWATYAGAELDLLTTLRGKRYGFEFKYGDAPTVTKSMQIARQDLKLKRLFVVYPGKESYPLGDDVEVISIQSLPDKLAALA